MRILFLGPLDSGTTSRDRFDALKRSYSHVDGHPLYPNRLSPLTLFLSHRSGYLLNSFSLERRLKAFLCVRPPYTLILVNGGENVSPRVLGALRSHSPKCRIINYNNDDPFGGRDGRKWLTYLSAVPHYDQLVLVREINMQEALDRGAKSVMRVYMSYDRIRHSPVNVSAEEKSRYSSDVIFVGTWMPERGPFMLDLIRSGVPLKIVGDRWDRAPEYKALRQSIIGRGVVGREYNLYIQCSKIALGLLSKGNRDLHTTRSTEIPAIGGLLCAERTEEHSKMYKDGVEASLWSDSAECSHVVKRLLENEVIRLNIRDRGCRRVRELNLSNDDVMKTIVEANRGSGNE